MTKLYALCAVACALSIAISSCNSKKEEHHETSAGSSEDWAPMDEFHMVMAESFHPFRDSADLEPAKANAESLVAAAEKWLNAPIPEKVDNDETKAKLQQLKDETVAFATISKTEDQAAIGEALTKL